jgi:hypothetical protein
MDSIVKYFEGEKLQCIIGLLIALAFIALSVYFLFLQKPIFKGFAYACLPLSAFLLIICTGVILRTSGDIERVGGFYQAAPSQMQSEEVPRMQKVMRNFRIIKQVEVGLILLGVGLVALFWRHDLMRGVAIALMVQGVILLLFDLAAEARGTEYMEFLRSLG